MAIAATDIKLRKSQRLTDNPDGGGRMVQAEVVDGELNNLFPNIGDEERTTGRTVNTYTDMHTGRIVRLPKEKLTALIDLSKGDRE